jgi:uncharacterized membrane protein
MKKILSYFLFFISILFITTSISAEEIKTFQSSIKINKDGTIDIKENINYDFGPPAGGLEKHGIYRNIPYIKTNSDNKKYKLVFSDFSVTDENGSPYNFFKSDDGQKVSLKIGDADKMITGIHNYLVSYKVSGSLTYFSDHDELYWNVTGNGWTVPINFARALVEMPETVDQKQLKMTCYTGSSGSSVSDCQTNIKAETMVFDTNNYLPAGSGLTIVAGFPVNIVARLEPKEFIPFSETLLGKIVGFFFLILGLIWYFLLPVYIVYRWWRYGRDPKGTVGVTTAWYDPPKTQDKKRFFTPGEVGTLGDETVDMKDISATIVDLARRGYLIIDERKKGDFFFIKGKKSISDKELLSFEKKLLEEIFKDSDSVRLKDKDLSSAVSEVKNNLYELVVSDGLFPKNPQTVRTIYYVIAVFALVTGNIFLAIVAFIFGRVMPRKTQFGVEAKNISFSLKNFLVSQQRQLEFQADKQMMFERLLPYAIAFGIERIWAKRFETLDIVSPSWYHGYSTGTFNSLILVSSLNSSLKSFQTAATPTRSSSGFSSGFSGGFSGGGGGGGGGGSW